MNTVSGALYFSAIDATNGDELWKTDGTEMGTVLVKDINPFADPFLSGSDIEHLTLSGGLLYFSADEPNAGDELWRTNGTEAGTVLVKDIHPSFSNGPEELTTFNGALYFSADDGTNGGELWMSDGTEAGTIMLKDINPAGDSWPIGFTHF